MARRKRRKSSRSRSRRRSSRRRSSSRRVAVVRHPVLVNPRRRGRRYRRNPGRRGFSVQGIMRQAIDGAQDALWIVGGKAVTNALPNLVGLSPTGALGIAVKAASALGAGFLFGFVSPNAAKLATAAGFAAILEPIIKGLNIPIISPALAADDDYDSLAAYPDEVSAIGAYPQASIGAFPDDYAMQY